MTDRPSIARKPALQPAQPAPAPSPLPDAALTGPPSAEHELHERQAHVRAPSAPPAGLAGEAFPSDAPRPARAERTDAATLRARARMHLEQGAVTHGARGDRHHVLAVLDTALATELVCMLRYRRHHFMASGLDARGAAAEFLEHALEEQRHADLLAARIVQLGGQPDFDPESLTRRSHAQYVAGDELQEMIREDLVAERVAIESYGEAIRSLGDDDPTTRRLLESILAVEEEHAEDLLSLLGMRRA